MPLIFAGILYYLIVLPMQKFFKIIMFIIKRKLRRIAGFNKNLVEKTIK